MKWMYVKIANNMKIICISPCFSLMVLTFKNFDTWWLLTYNNSNNKSANKSASNKNKMVYVLMIIMYGIWRTKATMASAQDRKFGTSLHLDVSANSTQKRDLLFIMCIAIWIYVDQKVEITEGMHHVQFNEGGCYIIACLYIC